METQESMGLVVQHNTSLTNADPSSVAAAEASKQRIQAAYIIAATHPRNVDEARIRILSACKRPRFAERVEYCKPGGSDNKKITGPSIRFAETAMREWGNILSDIQVVYEDEMIRRVKVYITDLQTNTQFSKEISVSKTVERKNPKGREVVSERLNTYGEKVYIVKATDDELMNKEASLISKSVRNEGLRLIPSDIIDEALETAKETLKSKDREDPDSAKRRVLDAFAELKVMPKDIEKHLGHPVDRISLNEIQELRGIYRSMMDEGVTWESLAEKKADPTTPLDAAMKRAEDLGIDASNCRTAKEVDALISEKTIPATSTEHEEKPEPRENKKSSTQKSSFA